MQSSVITTRGHDFKLYKIVIEYDLQKYYFVLLKVHLLIVLRKIKTSFGVAKTFIITIKQP